MTATVARLSAFPFEGRGGNPAGVVLNGEDLMDSTMQEIAAQVGHSETIFITSRNGLRLRVRYFSPEMEVDFCGHATIAAGVALGYASGHGEYVFETNTGDVNVNVTSIVDGFAAELTSHQGTISPIDDEVLTNLLAILSWPKSVVSNRHLPMIANSGNSHPIIVLDSPKTLQNLDYQFEVLKDICRANKWPTLQLIAQESERVWRSRNPFAFGGVYEDPATGSAAAAFGVYLRETGAAAPGDTFTIKQGFEMGQPCLLKVTIGSNECTVSGTAIQITD
ncbi:MAG: Trans-2,3-dihydro-3-hydroxyanthranilate isomerase [Actinomycetota bacterium]|jgi:PhzF family phenazine biosynthesis protein